MTSEALERGEHLQWPRERLSKTAGFTHPYTGSSLRRVQFPVVNYVALTIHKLMGDTFSSIATSVSDVESRYGLWLSAQIYVILSRVRQLSRVFFVGDKKETLAAIRTVLLRRSMHDERINELFSVLRSNQASPRTTAVRVPSLSYIRNHFSVPETENGFVFLLVSLKDENLKTFHVGETEESLASQLRHLNSSEVSQKMYLFQPWAMAAFMWQFDDENHRIAVKEEIEYFLHSNPLATYDVIVSRLQNNPAVALGRVMLCVCGTVKSLELHQTD